MSFAQFEVGRKYRFSSKVCLAVTLALWAAVLVTQAATATWTNAFSGDWNTPVNWDIGAVPGAADVVRINTGTAILTSPGPGIGSLQLGQAAGASQLIVGADLQIANNIVGIGSASVLATNNILQTNGTVTVTGTTSSYVRTNGTYDIGGGTLKISGNQRFDLTGTLKISGNATVNVGGGTGSTPRFGPTAGSAGRGMQLGGTFTAGGTFFVGNQGVGTYELHDGTIWASNNFSVGASSTGPGNGALTQTGGNIFVGSALAGSGQAFVGQSGNGIFNLSGGTFSAQSLTVAQAAGISGTINQEGGTIDLLSGPAGPGSMTLGNSGTGSYSIGPGTLMASNLMINGTLNVNSNADIRCTGVLGLGGSGRINFTFGTDGIGEMVFTGAGVSTVSATATLHVDGSRYSGAPATFTLINASSFDNTPALTLSGFPEGVTSSWDAASGDFTISVGPPPPRFTCEVINGALELSWPWAYRGWLLEAQTNQLSIGLTTNWFVVPNPGASNHMTLPIDPANPCVFYRLARPTSAFDPSPANGWQRADPLTMLRWSATRDASFNVYFGTDTVLDAADFKTNQVQNMYYPGPLMTNSTYFWRVDLITGGNVITGAVWSFKTGIQPGVQSYVNLLPNSPSDYFMRDWRQVAQQYTALASDFSATGKFLPTVWWDTARPNFELNTPFIPSFVGIDIGGDALNLFPTIVGATLVGEDMSNRNGSDWVRSMQQFQGTSVGRKVIGNNKTGEKSTGLWYDVMPGIYFFQAADLYPATAQIVTPYSFQPGGASMETVMYETASKWHEVLDFLGGGQTGIADFTGVVGFNTVTMEIEGRDGTHPGVLECAAGLAWIEYMSYRKFGDAKFLASTKWALNYLDTVSRNPMHNGIQMGYGALTATRMNAELGYCHDVDQLVRWTFGEGQPLRDGWGVLYGSWGGHEVSGLIGTEGSRGGESRAYAKQGYNLVASLVPMVRYDQRYARAIGKWVLHIASSSRHYYQTFLPDDYRDTPFWAGDPNGVVPFESLRGYHNQAYFQGYLQDLQTTTGANAEVTALVAAAVTNLPPMWSSGISGPLNGGYGLCLYFGGDVGLMGGIVKTTSVEKILQLNMVLTDFYRDPAYPSFLYYNPYNVAKQVNLDVGSQPVDVYDTVTHQFLLNAVTGAQSLSIPADSARAVVFAPAGGTTSIEARKLKVNGVTVDFYYR